MRLPLFFATFAFATFPALAAPDTSTYDWRGFYAGISAGHISGKNHWDDLGNYRLKSSTRGAAFAGYNYQRGRHVLGIEAQQSFGSVAERDDAAYRYTSLQDLRIRIGHTYGRSMAYLAAGYSRARFHDDDARFSMNGFNLGAGVDFALGRNFAVGLDFTTRRFKDNCPHDRDIKGRVDSASVRLSYRF